MNSTALATIGSREIATANEMKAHVNRIQEVMQAVMKVNTHYGKIPGAGDKPTLFKPGAEVLCATFRIAPSYRIEDLSDSDSVRYRVTCIGTHQSSGIVLGEGLGEASSSEEKYKWRGAVCKEEWDETPVDRRRNKWRKGNPEPYVVHQLRTEPSDIANTVLKMAAKRAQVAMTLNVTAASDIFAQDLEDIPAENLHGNEGAPENVRRSKPATQTPRAKSVSGEQPAKVAPKCSPDDILSVKKKLEDYGVSPRALHEKFGVATVADLPATRVKEVIDWIVGSNEGGAND